MDEFTLGVLQNDEVIAAGQDIPGKEANFVWRSGDSQVWAQELADGKIAIGLLNLGGKETDLYKKECHPRVKDSGPPFGIRRIADHADGGCGYVLSPYA